MICSSLSPGFSVFFSAVRSQVGSCHTPQATAAFPARVPPSAVQVPSGSSISH